MEHGVHCDRISNNDRLFRVSNRNEQRKSAFPLMHACSASSYLRIVYSKGKIIARNLMALNRIVIWCGIHFRHEASRARVYMSIARKQIRLRRHPVHPTRCTLRHTRFRRVSRYDEVVLLPLGRLNKAIGAGRPPNPPPYVRSVRKRKLQLRVNGGNTKPSFIPRVFNEACDR